MNINERFNKIIRTLYAGNKSAFAAAIGVTPSVVDNIVGKRQGKPSFEVLEKVCSIPQINIVWLITGNGEPFSFSNPTPPSATNPDLATLLNLLKEKDALLLLQAQEIGALKERIAQLEKF